MLGILSWRPGNPATDKSIYVVRDGDLRRPRTAPVITLVQRPSRATTGMKFNARAELVLSPGSQNRFLAPG